MKIVRASGQTCNQFWIYTNFIADAIERNENISFWIPDLTMRHYPQIMNSSFISFPLYFKVLSKWFGYENYINLISSVFGNQYTIFLASKFLKFIPSVKFISADVTVDKSPFRKKHLEKLKLIFTPEEAISECVNIVFNRVIKKNTLFIGIHIRHGDYRKFQNGKYFYSLAQYSKIMQQLISLFFEYDVTFFVASNERIDFTFFVGMSCFGIENGCSTKDLHGLIKCDYIVGPPSTFSAWASLCGDVPLYFIDDINRKISRNDFTKIKDSWL